MNKYIYLFIFFFVFTSIDTSGQNLIDEIEYELSLNEAIEIGLRNNPEIKQSYEKINEAKGKFWSGISLPSPELSINYEYVPTGKNLRNFNERTIEISQSFEFPTNYFLYGSKYSNNEESVKKENLLSILNVTYKIKSAYHKLIWALDQQKIEHDNLSLAEEFLQKAGIRFNVGEGTNLELLTAKVQYTEALNNIEKQKNQILLANAELNFAIGNPQDRLANYKPTGNLDFVEFEIDEQKLVNDSFEKNPEILISSLSVERASIEKSLAWSSLLPNLNLSYLKQTLEGNINYYGASFGISIPVWFLFDQRGKIQEASAGFNISESELEQTRNRILLNIKQAYTQFFNEQKQVQLYRLNLLPQAEEVYTTANKSYEAGEITYIEFLQAKQLLTNSKSNYLKSLLDYHLAILELELAAGFDIKEWSK